MSLTMALARKEFRSAFNSPVGYAVILGFVVFSSIWLYFIRGFFLNDIADLRDYFIIMPYILAFLVPAITMRSWAEERRLGTYEVLLTFPLPEYRLVLGKFFSGLFLILLALALTLPVPLSAGLFGNFDIGVIAAMYLGVILVAMAALAIGEYISSLSKNQISAFILTVLVLLMLVFINSVASNLGLSGVLLAAFNWFSLIFHFISFPTGVIDSADVAFYLILCVGFLAMTAWGLRHRKWS